MRRLADTFTATPGRTSATLLAALAVWLLATLWLRPLTLPDEGRYVGVAFAMSQGDWLTPRLHGLPYFHKPPLMYWIDAAAFRVFGANEFAARLAPALGAWLMGAALFLDLRRRRGIAEAALALGVLATSPFFFVGGQFANLDMLVAGLITVTIVAALRGVDAPSSAAALRWSLAAWCAAALGVLAKGLIGIVLPALVLLPWLLAQRRWAGIVRLLHPLALLCFCAIALPWFIAIQSLYPGFFDYFFLEQHVRRYAQTGFNNVQPFWFFVPVLLLLTLPWSLWLAALVRRRTPTVGEPAALYAWWAVVVVAFFSLPPSKLVGYVLPALAPLAGLLGLAVARGRAWRWVMPAAALACLAIVAALAARTGHSNRELALRLRQEMQPGDRVVFVGGPYFDVPFYARLSSPPSVVSDWDDPAIATRDDWRKELSDAARFASPAGQQVLLRPDELARLRCGRAAVWLLSADSWQPPGSLGTLEAVARDRRSVLWRASPAPASCP